MSDEEGTQIIQTENGQMLTAEYRDGQLQIVEVAPFDKDNETHILSDLSSPDETRYVQVLDGDKGVVHLDLLSLIKCRNSGADGDATYQVVGTSHDGDTTFTCVLADDGDAENASQDSYVVIDSVANKEPLLYLQSSLQQIRTQQRLRSEGKDEPVKPLTPEEIYEKAKLLEKAKYLSLTPKNGRGRKRKSDLPPPMELISSPGFKLYLYSCKMCSFKCNAMPDMSKHRATHNAKKGSMARAGYNLQCPKCPFRANAHSQLIIHDSRIHSKQEVADKIDQILPDKKKEDGTVEVLVCGACGFETSSRADFKRHAKSAHSLALGSTLTAIVVDRTVSGKVEVSTVAEPMASPAFEPRS